VSEYVTVCLEQVLSTPAPAPSVWSRLMAWFTFVRF